jgi:hypothetical protein
MADFGHRMTLHVLTRELHRQQFFYSIYFLKLPNSPWVNLKIKKIRKITKPPLWNHIFILF